MLRNQYNENDVSLVKIAPAIVGTIFLVVLGVLVFRMSIQIESLSAQVAALQSQTATLSSDYESISEEVQDISTSVKNMDAIVGIVNKRSDKNGSSIINIMNCITTLYHKTGLCKNKKQPCIECMDRVIG
jgi:outer membrane murein-binding lipoprotein Lpp